ncbi:MAG: mechanosensitive ion channel [bacterium]|nr:mechanosensitive ion channel [bacterium]
MLREARRIIEDVLSADERILADPAPDVAVSELADSSVNFVVRPWVRAGDFWAVKFAVTEAIKLAFDEQGVSIPFPQMDVHIPGGSGPEPGAEAA